MSSWPQCHLERNTAAQQRKHLQVNRRSGDCSVTGSTDVNPGLLRLPLLFLPIAGSRNKHTRVLFLDFKVWYFCNISLVPVCSSASSLFIWGYNCLVIFSSSSAREPGLPGLIVILFAGMIISLATILTLLFTYVCQGNVPIVMNSLTYSRGGQHMTKTGGVPSSEMLGYTV